MSIGALKTEADLKRFIEQQVRIPGVVPIPALPFKNLKFGPATLTFAGETLSATTEVKHGLNAVPAAIVAISHTAPSGTKIPRCNAYSEDDDSFLINGSLAEAHTGAIAIFWIAVA